MIASVDELVGFLLACIAEDEAAAREAALAVGQGEGSSRVESGSYWVTGYHELYRSRKHSTGRRHKIGDFGGLMGIGPAAHASRWDPARVLAECESKRRIIDLHRSDLPWPHTSDPCDAHDANSETVPCDTLLALAPPFSDRPGYRQEWTP